jgi:hypothetical protein
MKITTVRAVIPRGTNEPRDWRTAMAQIAVLVDTDAGVTGLEQPGCALPRLVRASAAR